MPVFNRQTCTKALSIGIILMGFVHIAATFTPLIAGKLALLPVGVSDAFTHFVRSLWGMLIGLIPTLAASGVYVLIFK